MKHKEYCGKSALVRYRGGAVGEEPVEDHMDGDPVRIMLGAGEVPPGVDEVLYDMEIGEKRTVVIPCDKAYGQHDPEGVQTYPRSYLRCGWVPTTPKSTMQVVLKEPTTTLHGCVRRLSSCGVNSLWPRTAMGCGVMRLSTS